MLFKCIAILLVNEKVCQTSMPCLFIQWISSNVDHITSLSINKYFNKPIL